MAGLSEYPKRLRASTQNPDVVYVRDDNHYAVHGQPANARGIELANSLLTDVDPEWRAEAPRYFERTERKVRALLSGESLTLRAW